MISFIFERLERSYGLTFTRRALGLISFSQEGISDSEMEDLLSLDDEVLDYVFQYSSPPIRRLPSHVW